ncbi:MAG: hypothetical protein K2K45_03040 [Muribaculaceae bacterium]|nr:hypothetical protein [Muribaculaceae bacterium]
MSKAQLKKYIEGLDREHLEEFVLDIYSDVKPAKEYLDFFLNPDVNKVTDKTRRALYARIFRANGAPLPRLRFSRINGIVKDFSAKVRDPYIVADLMEYLLMLLCEYGCRNRTSESFVRSLAASFGRFSKWLVSSGIEIEYKEKMRSLIEKTHGIDRDCTDRVYDAVDECFEPD